MAEAVRLRAVAIESGVRVPMAVAELADVPSLSLQQAAWLSLGRWLGGCGGPGFFPPVSRN